MVTAPPTLRRLALAAAPPLIGLNLVTDQVAKAAQRESQLRASVVNFCYRNIADFFSAYTRGCVHEPRARLQRTSDNGIHFTTLHLSALAFVTGNPLGNLSELIFANSMDGYAFLNATYPLNLYVTVDGAKS